MDGDNKEQSFALCSNSFESLLLRKEECTRSSAISGNKFLACCQFYAPAVVDRSETNTCQIHLNCCSGASRFGTVVVEWRRIGQREWQVLKKYIADSTSPRVDSAAGGAQVVRSILSENY